MAIPDNTQDASFITIGVIDNAIEAQLVSSILTEQEIPTRSFPITTPLMTACISCKKDGGNQGAAPSENRHREHPS
ncbi:MAG: hypothetical protein R2875_08680 [Desulfobacterales bacterium]